MAVADPGRDRFQDAVLAEQGGEVAQLSEASSPATSTSTAPRSSTNARRRWQGSLCQAPLDTGSWSSQRDLLLAQHGGPAPPGAPAHEQLARFRLIELLTGTHPRYLPGPLQLPRQRGPDYAIFVFTMPAQLDLCLRRQASALLSQAGISEPVTWEPPSDWAPGIRRPGPDPEAVSAEQRIRRLLVIPGQPDLQHAARQLGTTTARLSRQVRQLEDIAGTALLRTGPDGLLTLTAHGRLFARDVHPVLESLEQSWKSNSDNHGTVPGARPSWGRDQGHLVNQALDLRRSWFAN